ncbi:alpha/beta hydrolase domain-containing protein [Plebeiibacterium marinum]|uniref:Alpha/beta hydrolase domain-containing protein n=1 Tax=Plebeiibacterium marinum TaxID=2992111 RepID=A0AAE3MGA9_9BACT|nr:alpha/beta hydrolase domain-containing protein [Plebeiobacterium marinum]MCW3807044.1 alpha/beta hydrolase domain-containing protein [Plebeiobacterium marinum]
MMKKNLLKSWVLTIMVIVIVSCNSNNDIKLPEPNVISYPGIPVLNMKDFKLPACSDYKVEEYIISGNATSYMQTKAPDGNGVWTVEEKDTASYVSRIVVMKPKDDSKFNGTVIVDWINVTGGFDFTPSRNMMWKEITRSGAIYVAVSAQQVGLVGGETIGGFAMPLKERKGGRYTQVKHPGDAFSFDIFSQVGRFLKGDNSSVVLGKLKPKHVIALGESQSAFYMCTYVNAVDPIAKVYDGFFIHSRLGLGAPLEGVDIIDFVNTTTPMKLTTKLRVPTLVFTTETDVLGVINEKMGMIGAFLARQPENDKLRIWEVAGTAHHDSYLHKVSRVDTCGGSYADIAKAYEPTNKMLFMKLDKPFNNAPQHHYVLEAAMSALQKWIGEGVIPEKTQQLEIVVDSDNKLAAHAVTDELGNIIGGIRSPWMDVPVSVLSSQPSSESFNALLIGHTEPFSPEKLDELYPGGINEYLQKFENSLNKDIMEGHILAADKEEIMEVARLSYKGTH